jgi:hypothetical protein
MARCALAQDGHLVHLILSRRNLLALLAKLDGWPDQSACAISVGDCFRNGAPVDDMLVLVSAEPDDTHYAAAPTRPARCTPRPRSTSRSTTLASTPGPSPGRETDALRWHD